MAAYDESLPGIVMMGGDSVLHPKRAPRYLNDLWYLGTNVSFPSWRQTAGNGSPEGSAQDGSSEGPVDSEDWAAEVFDEEPEDGAELSRHHTLAAGATLSARTLSGQKAVA